MAEAAPSAAASSKEARRLLLLSGVGGFGEELDDGGSADDDDEEAEEEDEARLDDIRDADNSEASVAPAPRADEGALEGFNGGSCGETALVDGDALALPPRWSEPNEEDEGPPTGVEGSASDRGGTRRRAAKLEAAIGAANAASLPAFGAALSGMSGHKIGHSPPDSRIASCRRRRSWRDKRKSTKGKRKLVRIQLFTHQLCISWRQIEWRKNY